MSVSSGVFTGGGGGGIVTCSSSGAEGDLKKERRPDQLNAVSVKKTALFLAEAALIHENGNYFTS